MRTLLSLLPCFLLGAVGIGCRPNEPARAQAAKPADALVGAWEGTLAVTSAKLRIVFHITRGMDGVLTATMDSPDQLAFGIACSKTEFKDGTLTIELSAAHGKYEGKLDATKREITGTWSQGTSFALNLRFTDKAVAKPNRPQEPKPPFPYDAREVSYDNTRDNLKLAGTLTLPKGTGPFPAALLITGSGPQNRDEELLGHKPFFVLADYLTRRGIAVLRVDDRGVGSSTGRFEGATSQDFAEDVKYGVAFLKTVKEIDAKRIGLIGHSEGGLIGPMVAAQDPAIAFVVMMAGPGVTGEQVMYKQAEMIIKAAGGPASAVEANRRIQSIMFETLKSVKDDAAASAQIKKKIGEIVAAQPEAERKSPQASTAAIEAQAKAIVNPWFRFFAAYDPAPTLRKVACPVLAINGEKDLQVPPSQNLPVIKASLAAGGNKDFQTVEMPGLNHLFQTCTTGSPTEYMQIEETISPAALKLMGDWIVAHTR